MDPADPGTEWGLLRVYQNQTEAEPQSTEICGVKSKPVLYILGTFCSSSCNTPDLPIIFPDPVPFHPGSARLAFPRNMPVSSNYPPVDIPNVDLWSFLFEREDRPFPDNKSKMYPVKNSSKMIKHPY